MAIVTVLLGDGNFTDNAYTSVNNWGVSIPYFTDTDTGAVPHQSNIPNPPLTYRELPDSWGFETWRGFDYVPPAIPEPQCTVGCLPPPPPTDVVPEPSQMIPFALSLAVGVLIRRMR